MYRDLRWVTIAETTNRVASIVTVPLLAQSFRPARYGLYRGIFLFVTLFLLLEGLFRFSTIVQKRLPELEREARRGLSAAAAYSLVGVASVAFVVFTIATESGLLESVVTDFRTLVSPHLPVVAGIFVTYPLYRLLNSICMGLDRFDLFSTLKFVREVGFLLIVVGLFFSDSISLGSVLWGYLLTDVLAIGIGLRYVHPFVVAWPDFKRLLDQLREISLPLVPNQIFKTLEGKIPDVIVLGAFGSATFASWVILFTFSRIFQLFSQPFSQLFLSKISGRLTDGDPIDSLLLGFYRYIVVLSVPIVAGGWIVGPELIQYVFGDGYIADSTLLVVLLSAFALQTIGTPGGSVFVATDSPEFASYVAFIRVGCVVTAAVLGGYLLHSLSAVAAGYLVGYILNLAVSVWYQTEYVSFSDVPQGDLLKFLGSLAVMVITTAVMQRFATDLVLTVAVVAVGAAVYFCCLYVIGFVNERDIGRFRKLVGV